MRRTERPDEPLTAVVLAAGRSTRMAGADKLHLPWAGGTVLAAVLRAVCGAPVAEVLVVTGPAAAAFASLPAAYGVRLVPNPEAAAGLAASIRRGVQAARPEAAGYLIVPGDLPLLQASTVAMLCAVFHDHRRMHPRPGIVRPHHAGRPGHPVLFDAAFRDVLCALRGDAGARDLLRQHRDDLVAVPVDDPGTVHDVDTPAAYAAALRRLHAAPLPPAEPPA